MSTQKVKPDPGALERQRRWSVGKNVGAFALVAAIGVAVVASTLGALGGRDATTPAEEPPTAAAGTSPAAQPGVAVIDQVFVDSINSCERLPVTRQEVESALGFRPEAPAPWNPFVSPQRHATYPAAQVESWGGVVFGCKYASFNMKQAGGQVVISAYSADAPPPFDRSEPVEGVGDEAEFSPFGNGDEHVLGPEGATSILQVRSGDLILRFNGGLLDSGGGTGFELPLLRQLAEDALSRLDEGAPATGITASGPFFLDLRTGGRTPLAESLAGGLNYAASPDGTRLAYGTRRGGGCDRAAVITVADVDGTDARTLHSPEGLDSCAARWSPDGTKLVYQERNGAVRDSVGDLVVQDLDSGRRTQLTDLELSSAWWWFLSPSFSPDGRNVIFHLPRGSSETTKWDVWSVPVTGGEPRLVLRNAAFPMLSPASGPEGAQIAFLSPATNDFAGRSISTGPADGRFRRTLVEASNSIWWPTMSPDGSRIAYQDVHSIYVVDVSTGESSRVADGETAEWLDDDTLIVTPE